MHENNTLQEALKKAQKMESDVDIYTPKENGWLEEKIEMKHRVIRYLFLCRSKL